MAVHLELVPPKVSADTIELLAFLLQEAHAGRVIGVAFVAMHKAYEYSVDVAGEAKTVPTLTRGMVAALDDQLARIVHPST